MMERFGTVMQQLDSAPCDCQQKQTKLSVFF